MALACCRVREKSAAPSLTRRSKRIPPYNSDEYGSAEDPGLESYALHLVYALDVVSCLT